MTRIFSCASILSVISFKYIGRALLLYPHYLCTDTQSARMPYFIATLVSHVLSSSEISQNTFLILQISVLWVFLLKTAISLSMISFNWSFERNDLKFLNFQCWSTCWTQLRFFDFLSDPVCEIPYFDIIFLPISVKLRHRITPVG